ncbi:MAG TPA: polysaccharide deacetylase family protein [Candidatus Saccharimonadales bacterium]|nr:polysaccharide deacetylase family protein [Candidatus Saccharimonadales bacterium]
MIKNALSVDLESFIHRELDPQKRTQKDAGFTKKATQYLLKILAKHQTKITFFVTGEVFEWYPDLIKDIKIAGHEIGYHSHRHIIIKDKKTLENEFRLSKEFLKKYKPIGFRAPKMFLPEDCLATLSSYGFKYDSSTYATAPYVIKGTKIEEFPVSISYHFGFMNKSNSPTNFSKKLLLRAVPYGSGFTLALLQKRTQRFISRANKKGQSANIFVHPWQFFDYDYRAGFTRNLYKRKINKTFEYLLSKNTFVPLKELL